MSERLRIRHEGRFLAPESGTFQYCDAERCIIMDSFTGQIQRRFNGGNAIGTVEEALNILQKGCSLGRDTIVILNTIVATFIPDEVQP
jgi:hypothetical protein